MRNDLQRRIPSKKRPDQPKREPLGTKNRLPGRRPELDCFTTLQIYEPRSTHLTQQLMEELPTKESQIGYQFEPCQGPANF